jgi:hypothetical protein
VTGSTARALRSSIGLIVLALGAACAGPAASPLATPSPAATPTVPPTATPQATPTVSPTQTAQSDPSPTTSAGLPAPVAAWSLRGDGKDSVGSLDLKFEGGYTITDAGVAFDGVSGRAVTDGPSPLDATQSVTLSAWVSHPTQLVDVPNVISLTGEGQLRMALAIAGGWYFGTSAADVGGGTPVRSNDWVHLVGVSDREAGAVRVYVNGELVGEKPASAPLAATGPLIIGAGLDTDANWWAGAVSDVSVYQAALTPDQIAELYSTTTPQGASPDWAPDPATYADGIFNGTWDYVLREGIDDAVLAQQTIDFGQSLDRPAIRLGFDGPLWWEGVAVDGQLVETNGESIGDIGIISVDGEQLTIAAWYGTTTFKWAVEGDQLTLTFVEECSADTGQCFDRDQVAAVDPLVIPMIEHTYTKSGDDASY